MDLKQLEDFSNKIQALHRSIKNVIEMVFAVSPLIVLSTQGWALKSLNSVYLLRVSFTCLTFARLLTIEEDFHFPRE